LLLALWLLVAAALAQEEGITPPGIGLLHHTTVEEILAIPEGRALIEAYLAIRRDYLLGSDEAALLQGAIRGMVAALDDPYVQYLTPEEVAAEDRVSRGPAAVAAIIFDGIGYLRISTFNSERVGEEARAVVQALMRRNVEGLVLDLRQNGGGLVRGGLQLLDLFIADAVLGYRSTRSGAAPLAFANPGAIDLPLVVLIDEGTASTAEMVAGALQTFQRATLYGMPSAGKGVGQTQISLSDGGSLRLVTFRWSLPDRRNINGIGLEPTVKIDGEAEAGSAGVVFGDPEIDPVLRRALRDLWLLLLEVAEGAEDEVGDEVEEDAAGLLEGATE
jgi:C-terminal processing protease CtpA/Prc